MCYNLSSARYFIFRSKCTQKFGCRVPPELAGRAYPAPRPIDQLAMIVGGQGSGNSFSHTGRCHGPYSVGVVIAEGGGRGSSRMNGKEARMEGSGKIE